MGESRNRKITEIVTRDFYGSFLLHRIMKGQPFIQVLSEGIKKNHINKNKEVFVPWNHIVTIFDESLTTESFVSTRVLGVTVSRKYADTYYDKFFTIKQVIRQDAPFTFSDGISNTTGNIKIPHDFKNERVIICVNHRQLKNSKDLFKILRSNMEITKSGCTYEA